MQGLGWIGLLQQIPADQVDQVILMTTNGTEINLQNIVRTDKDFLVVRGRLAASTESKRIFVIPFDHVSHLGFRESLDESRMAALLGPVATSVRDDAERAAFGRANQERENGVDTLPAVPVQGDEMDESMRSLMLRPIASPKPALLERLRRPRPTVDLPKPPSP